MIHGFDVEDRFVSDIAAVVTRPLAERAFGPDFARFHEAFKHDLGI